jgi:nitrite reductase (NADH) large subunit
MERERLVVVGNGMAGMRTVEELLVRAPDRYAITVFGAEPRPNYNRILLSALLAGEIAEADIVIHPMEWYARHDITLHAGDPVRAINAAARCVTTASGRTATYDRLLLATGSRPVAPPIAGLDLPGVCAFRTVDDVATMLRAAAAHRQAVVIGGGLLGLEAAWGLRRRGMTVTVVHLMPSLMERQLDQPAARLLRTALEHRGITVLTDAETEALIGDDRVRGIRLADGRELPADLVVLAIGVRPNVDLARRAGLEVNRAIVVRDDMRCSAREIFAVGECVEHRGQTFGLVTPLWEQAKVCAAQLAGDVAAVYAPAPPYTSLKITGIDVYSAGALMAADSNDDEITFHDPENGVYKKLVLRNDRIVGTVLYGDIADGAWYVELMQRQEQVGGMRDWLLFGRDIAERNAVTMGLAA